MLWLLVINKVSLNFCCSSLITLSTEPVQSERDNMNTVSLCTITGEDSCQMTVITLRMNMVLIGIIKLGYNDECPWSCARRQMSTWDGDEDDGR